MSGATDFTKLVPGFDFLQGLMKGASLPVMGQWIAPTLNPEELEKRIQELRTVQFWLEQNARLLGATIQALEVQRMTLTTLKTMNLPMAELRESMKLRVPEPVPAPEAEPHPTPATPNPAPAAANPGPVDPMQWWSALTQQFTELAASALQDSASDAAKPQAGTEASSAVRANAAAAPVKPARRAPATKRSGSR